MSISSVSNEKYLICAGISPLPRNTYTITLITLSNIIDILGTQKTTHLSLMSLSRHTRPDLNYSIQNLPLRPYKFSSHRCKHRRNNPQPCTLIQTSLHHGLYSRIQRPQARSRQLRRRQYKEKCQRPPCQRLLHRYSRIGARKMIPSLLLSSASSFVTMWGSSLTDVSPAANS